MKDVTKQARTAKTSKDGGCEFTVTKGPRKGLACARRTTPKKTLCARHVSRRLRTSQTDGGGWGQFLQDLGEYNRTAAVVPAEWLTEPTEEEMSRRFEEVQSEWDEMESTSQRAEGATGDLIMVGLDGGGSILADDDYEEMWGKQFLVDDDEEMWRKQFLVDDEMWEETRRTIEESNSELLAADRSQYEEDVRSLSSKSTRKLRAEMNRLEGDMKSIGGWLSKEHGRYHTMRRRYIDMHIQIVANQWGQPAERCRTELVQLGSEEYAPDGEYELCPNELCGCEENPSNLSWTDIYGMWV